MIYLDSWVWLEYVFEGERWTAAEDAIQRANSPDVGGIVASTVVADVSYRIRRQKDADTAADAIDAIRDLEHVEILPVTDEIAEYAAAIRDEYGRSGEFELSYAEAIHLAMAAAVPECDALYSGDPAFANAVAADVVAI